MTQPVTTRGVRSVPELLLPAGSFDAAIAAIDGGADALYFGFASFSARKQARNFDPVDYRRLLRHARQRGIRLYVTLNTIVLERELEEISRLLVFLSRFPPDALIVQDWGLVRLVRDRFPALALHASTQMAVQTPEAASLAAELGVSRIVLPRESSLATLRRFAAALPSMEFEVFVHGALCYSFSGLCLASGTLLGRSGNRGECAQVCRSYYNAPGDGERSESSYWFSCKDLNLAARVAELADAGAASLKVEGRMKAPEYCYSVAQLYRGMLDRLAGEGPDDEELARRDCAARIAFARSPTEAWLFARGGQDMIDAQYPGHRGALAGRIVESGGGRIVVDLESRLGLRDGLLMFEAGDPRRPLPFAVTGLCDARTGREIVQARPGMRVELECPASAPTGSELRRISAREQDRRRPSPEEYAPERQALDGDLRIGTEGLSLHIRAPLFPGAGRNEIDIAPGEQLDLQRSRRPGGLLDALSVFSESGDADFVLVPHLVGGEVALPGRDAHSENVELAALFIPPSRLKRE
ncbi:MAG TPA: peptidase U32 family protein, partial [Rectinemataceae bacterium]|nr:peptidase U32 family protein [Rectinemataceae bacterium]